MTGNTGIDALLQIAARPTLQLPPEVLSARHRAPRLVLVTAHRRENFGAPLQDICTALRILSENNRDVCVVYAVHPNPNVCVPVHDALWGLERVVLMSAFDYLPFVSLMQACDLILTDSGGIQEEAPSFGKPVLVMRETTERVEAIAAGTARLVGTSPEVIVAETERLLRDPAAYARMVTTTNPYGDGRASERIVARVLAHQKGGGDDLNPDTCIAAKSAR